MLEILDHLLLNRHVLHIGLAKEGIDNDSDEKIEEDLRDNDLKEQMEANSDISTTAMSSERISGVTAIRNYRLIRLTFSALVEDVVVLRRVEHDGIPGLTRRATNQREEGRTETLEVHMLVHFACSIDINEGELCHANNREHEDQKHEQETERGHRGQSSNQCLEDLLKPLLFLDQTEYTTNSKCA